MGRASTEIIRDDWAEASRREGVGIKQEIIHSQTAEESRIEAKDSSKRGLTIAKIRGQREQIRVSEPRRGKERGTFRGL